MQDKSIRDAGLGAGLKLRPFAAVFMATFIASCQHSLHSSALPLADVTPERLEAEIGKRFCVRGDLFTYDNSIGFRFPQKNDLFVFGGGYIRLDDRYFAVIEHHEKKEITVCGILSHLNSRQSDIPAYTRVYKLTE